MNRFAMNGSPALEELLEEFAGRLEAGEALDVAAFAAAHPEHAEQLRRVLPTMLVLADLGRSRSAGGAAPPSAGPTPSQSAACWATSASCARWAAAAWASSTRPSRS